MVTPEALKTFTRLSEPIYKGSWNCLHSSTRVCPINRDERDKCDCYAEESAAKEIDQLIKNGKASKDVRFAVNKSYFLSFWEYDDT